ncbi:MAG TPA: DUF3048 domain-containing protein [Acidimicrobiia bacterium]|nr:DUF3048 domain-containing protein [Acidimicrobiia bacterium]
MRRSLVALAVFIAACTGAAETTTTVSTAAMTTTARPTTTTSRPTTTTRPLPTSPINGLPVEDADLLDRRLIAVKVDNHADARPQSGIDQANVIVEVPVEGITRFIALFHDTDAAYLGPVRSGRPTDGKFLNPLGAVFAISGGQDWVLSGIRNEGVEIIGEVPPAMFRVRSRFAPHNLYADTTALREIADDRGYADDPPPTLFEFGELPPGSESVNEIEMNFGNGFVVDWTYDRPSGRYLRSFNGNEAEVINEEGETSPLAADTLVVMLATRFIAQAPAGGTSVPAVDTVGEGQAYVFAGGRMIEGTWSRESSDDQIVFEDDQGDPLPVPPGFIWMSIVPEQNGIEFS